MDEFIKVVLLFFLYSFVGWLWETVYCSLKAHHFVYRGFLVGPITPIYGFGILGVLYFIEPFQNNLLVLYVLATLLVTLLEYLTSYGLEKLFHATWWDYHDVPLNINGRVAVPVSLFWGIACVLIVKVINPHMLSLEETLATWGGFYLPVVLIALVMLDLGYTLANLQAFQQAVKQLEQAIDTKKTSLRESLDSVGERVEQLSKDITQHTQGSSKRHLEWLDSIKENKQLRNTLPKMNFNQRRMLQNFPHLRIKNVANTEDIRQLVKELRKKK